MRCGGCRVGRGAPPRANSTRNSLALDLDLLVPLPIVPLPRHAGEGNRPDKVFQYVLALCLFLVPCWDTFLGCRKYRPVFEALCLCLVVNVEVGMPRKVDLSFWLER